MFGFSTRVVEPVPVVSYEQIAAEALQHEALIAQIKEEVCQDYDNLASPEPFVMGDGEES